MQKLIAFIGSHGSGKTSYAIKMLETLNQCDLTELSIIPWTVNGQSHNITFGTKALAIGRYEKGKYGGCDGRGGVRNVLKYLTQPIQYDYVICEGVLMASENVMKGYLKSKRKVYLVCLSQKSSTLRDRLNARNGGKIIGNGYIDKNASYRKYVEKYKKMIPQITYIDINTENTSIDEGVKKILSIIS